MAFTKEELEAMAAADAEIETSFSQTQEEIERSRDLDKAVKWERMDNREREIAARRKAYREAKKICAIEK